MRAYTSGTRELQVPHVGQRQAVDDRRNPVHPQPAQQVHGVVGALREPSHALEVLLGSAVVLPEDHVARRFAVAVHRDDRGVLARADDRHDVVAADAGGGQCLDCSGLHGVPDLPGVLLGDAPGLGERVHGRPGRSRGPTRDVDNCGLRPARAQVDGQDVALALHGHSLHGSRPAYESAPCADAPSGLAERPAGCAVQPVCVGGVGAPIAASDSPRGRSVPTRAPSAAKEPALGGPFPAVGAPQGRVSPAGPA